MFWAKKSPCPDETTDFGVIRPVSTSARASTRGTGWASALPVPRRLACDVPPVVFACRGARGGRAVRPPRRKRRPGTPAAPRSREAEHRGEQRQAGDGGHDEGRRDPLDPVGPVGGGAVGGHRRLRLVPGRPAMSACQQRGHSGVSAPAPGGTAVEAAAPSSAPGPVHLPAWSGPATVPPRRARPAARSARR